MAKLEAPIYKLYDPNYHPQRPIIVDEAVESPETVTLRYEEAAAARANGGDLPADTTALLPMSTAFKAQSPHLQAGFGDAPYQPYASQPYSGSNPTHGTPHINNLHFETSPVTAQYGENNPNPINVLSCVPRSGAAGTRLQLKVWSQADISAMASPPPYVSICFGTQKCPAQAHKEGVSQGGHTYSISTEVPQPEVVTYSGASTVLLSLVVELENGEELARLGQVGSFTYHHNSQGQSTSASGLPGDAGPPEDDTGPCPSSPAQPRGTPPHLTVVKAAHPSSSPGQTPHQHQQHQPQQHQQHQQHHPQHPQDHQEEPQQSATQDLSTNTYGYPPSLAAGVSPSTVHHQQQAHPNYTTATYGQDSPNMLGYPHQRTTTLAEQYGRASHRGTAWSTYPHHDRYATITRSTSAVSHPHTSITRSSMTSSAHTSHNGAPVLVRTSTLPSTSPVSASSMPGNSYNPWQVYPAKAVLNIVGSLDTMSQDWSQEEWDNKRRIVLCRKKQAGSCIEASFRAVPVGERPPNSICVSCIWWPEKGECFITSVDAIYLLEQLVAVPGRFTIEEKNRIRRNLEGFKPLTVSKAKAESEEFFKVIMGFGNPKPRNIEKDVKVFPWKILSQALKKIISKYSASPSSTVIPASATASTGHLMTPGGLGGHYNGGLPPTPGPSPALTEPTVANGFTGVPNRASDSIPSPRSLSGVPAAWPGSYGAAASTRTHSPSARTQSPQQPTGMGITSLPTAYDTRAAHSAALAGSYSLAGSNQVHHALSSPLSAGHAAENRWDGYGLSSSSGTYPSHPNVHNQVYNGSYGDTAQRA